MSVFLQLVFLKHAISCHNFTQTIIQWYYYTVQLNITNVLYILPLISTWKIFGLYMMCLTAVAICIHMRQWHQSYCAIISVQNFINASKRALTKRRFTNLEKLLSSFLRPEMSLAYKCLTSSKCWHVADYKKTSPTVQKYWASLMHYLFWPCKHWDDGSSKIRTGWRVWEAANIKYHALYNWMLTGSTGTTMFV